MTHLRSQTFWRLLIGLTLLYVPPALAQKEVLYSQYLVNPLSINPAYAGSRESFHLTAQLRRKWFGVRAAPLTQSVSADGAIANGRIGLGFQALNDRLGVFGTTGAYGSVAYRFTLPALAKLSVGVQGGVSVLPLYDFATGLAINRAVPSVGVGVYYQSDRWFGGVSVPELTGQILDLTGRLAYPTVRPLLVQAGTRVDLTDNVVLVPSVLVSKVANRSLGVDLNVKAWLNEELGVGASYRQNPPTLIPVNYVQLTAEYQATSAIRLGYLFYSQTPESPRSNLYFQRSVHEIMVRYSPGALRFSF